MALRWHHDKPSKVCQENLALCVTASRWKISELHPPLSLPASLPHVWLVRGYCTCFDPTRRWHPTQTGHCHNIEICEHACTSGLIINCNPNLLLPLTAKGKRMITFSTKSVCVHLSLC